MLTPPIFEIYAAWISGNDLGATVRDQLMAPKAGHGEYPFEVVIKIIAPPRRAAGSQALQSVGTRN
jgi:hypothetical protein